ncbi:MAG: hypothetical protein ACTSRZ_01090 [Promethearchaeota archaeon]
MQKIHFTVFSQAYYVDMKWGFGCPSGGIKRMGDIFHNYDIPITWLVSPKSARCEQEMFKLFHDKYGDEIAMMIRFNQKRHENERIVANSMNVDDYRKLIRSQKEEILKYLPWAEIKIAAQGIRTQEMIQALMEEGFIGIHGHCYCQIGTDSITDFGSPWGSFRIRPDDFHLPAKKNQKGLIAFEWTQRDLNRSFHTAYPELWSTDPNDVERGGVCTDENVEWWKNMFMQYERALPLNKYGIWFQFHQESHEMTWGEVCKPFTEKRVIFTADMMDEFLDWLTESKNNVVEFLTATEAAELYIKSCPTGTIPMYFPSAWTEVPSDLPFWKQLEVKKGYAAQISKHTLLPQEELFNYLNSVLSKDPIKAMRSPPWMDSFFFYDEECQIVFDIGKIEPIAIMNYLNYEPSEELVEEMKNERGGGAPGYYIEEHVPQASLKGKFDKRGFIIADEEVEIEIENTLKKELPYGIFLWISNIPNIIEHFINIDNNSCNNRNNKSGENGIKSKIKGNCLLKDYKISPDQGVFLRFNIKPGKNKLIF